MVEYTKKQKKYLAGIHETTRNNKNLAVKLFEQKFNRLITPPFGFNSLERGRIEKQYS